jgi:phenylalanyl-tRNA synthetase beta chain
MRLPLIWLHDYCDPGLAPVELATKLALTGTEVDRVHAHGVAGLEHFVVGKVLESGRHPDADRLSVVRRRHRARASRRRSSAGAPNVAAGQTVAVARPGASCPTARGSRRPSSAARSRAG